MTAVRDSHYAMFRLALLATITGLTLAGQAFAVCDSSAPRRTLELLPGQHTGGENDGFSPAGLHEREVILTFDDGPNPDTTPLILDTLEANCVPATFFLIGPAASAYPGLIRRELAGGHTVGGLTWSHEPLTGKSIVTAIADIARGFRPLTAADAPINLFRFPGMASSPELLDWLKRHGITAVGADIDAGVSAGASPDAVLEHIENELMAKGGGILALKDSEPGTVELLQGLIDFLRAERFTVIRLKAVSASGE